MRRRLEKTPGILTRTVRRGIYEGIAPPHPRPCRSSMMPNRAFAVLGLLLAPGGLHAQVNVAPPPPAATWGASLGFNRAPVLGLAVTGFAAGDFRAGLPLRGTVALDVLLSPDEDSPYYRTSAYTGVEGCHDSRNGAHVEDSYCVPEVDAAARAELMAVLTRHWGLGAGARVSSARDAKPYGLVRYQAPFRTARTSWFGQLSVGDHFSQLDAGIAIRF
jgi:hypothetical protein